MIQINRKNDKRDIAVWTVAMFVPHRWPADPTLEVGGYWWSINHAFKSGYCDPAEKAHKDLLQLENWEVVPLQ